MRCKWLFGVFAVLGGCVSSPFPERYSSLSSVSDADSIVSQLDTQLLQRHVTDGSDAHLASVAYRNDVVLVTMRAIDAHYGRYQTSMVSADAGRNIAVSSVSTAFSVWGALVSGGDTSQILSGLTGLLTTFDTSVDKETYLNQTMPALFEVMSAERLRIEAEIRQKFALSTDDYPLADALKDLERYFRAGSIVGALEVVSENAAEERDGAEQTLRVMRDADFVTAEKQERIRSFLGLVDQLTDVDMARSLLATPPVSLDALARTALISRLNGNSIAGLSLSDAQLLLKMVLVIQANRAETSLDAWEGALRAAI